MAEAPTRIRKTRRFVVAAVADVPVGKRKIVEVPGIGEVGIFNIRGEYFAVRNVCPHQGGPMCRGRLTGTTRAIFEDGKRPEVEYIRDGEILRCPWHAWEFDIRTGEALFGNRTRVIVYNVGVETPEIPPDNGEVPGNAETYPVTVEAAQLFIELPVRASEGTGAPMEDNANAG